MPWPTSQRAAVCSREEARKGAGVAQPRIDVGMYITAKPPLAAIEQLTAAAQELRLDSVFVWDHVVDFFPQAVWDADFSSLRRGEPVPPPVVRLPGAAGLPRRQGARGSASASA